VHSLFKAHQKVYQVLPNDLRGHQKKFQVNWSRFDRLPIASNFYQCKIGWEAIGNKSNLDRLAWNFFWWPLRSFGSTWWYLQLSCALLKKFFIFHYFLTVHTLFKSNQKIYQVLPNDLRGHQKNFQVNWSRFDRLPIASDFYQCKIRWKAIGNKSNLDWLAWNLFWWPLRSFGSTWWYLQLSCALSKNFLIFHYFFNSAHTFQIQSKGIPSSSKWPQRSPKKISGQSVKIWPIANCFWFLPV